LAERPYCVAVEAHAAAVSFRRRGAGPLLKDSPSASATLR
jgi:hypothetical protein